MSTCWLKIAQNLDVFYMSGSYVLLNTGRFAKININIDFKDITVGHWKLLKPTEQS